MGLKKRSKVSAEFSMSSLTDIIFLLLIFFMLTSTLVAPNSLNLRLPGKSQKQTSAPKKIDEVRVGSKGDYYFNGRRMNIGALEETLARKVRLSKKKYNMALDPHDRAPVEAVIAVMDLALTYNINAFLTPEVK